MATHRIVDGTVRTAVQAANGGKVTIHAVSLSGAREFETSVDKVGWSDLKVPDFTGAGQFVTLSLLSKQSVTVELARGTWLRCKTATAAGDIVDVQTD